MKLAVVVCGDGRYEYLARSTRALKEHVLHPITARCMINDEANPDYCDHLDEQYPDWAIAHTGRVGMAGAVQAGFDLALSYDPDFVLWIEEDMELIAPVPVREAADRLDHDPTLAQMLFKREGTVHDGNADQLVAILARAVFTKENLSYATHDFIFSLNPCLIPASVMEHGYSEDNEAGMTKKLLDLGYKFGVWGRVGDPPFARHIGTMRSQAWRL